MSTSERSKMAWRALRERALSRWWLIPVAIFVLTRILDTAILAALMGLQTHSTFLGHHVMPIVEDPRNFINGLANWDGQWYRQIALHGYPSTLPTSHGAVIQNPWAFFPLFPALTRLLMFTGMSFPIAASLLSLICGLAACCLLYRMILKHGSQFTASMAVLGLCLSPAAIVLGLAYTESLALLIILAALASLGSRRYGLFVICSLLLAFTRPIALPLAALCGLHGIIRWRSRNTDPFPMADRIKVVVSAGIAVAGFGLWPLIAGIVTGRSNAYFETQQSWAHSTGPWQSWLREGLLFHSLVSLAVVVAVLLAAGLMVRQRSAKVWGNELRIWTVIYPLYLLGTTRQTSSIIRYLMLTVTPGWPVPSLSERATTVRSRALLIASVVVIGAVAQYFWTKYFYVFWQHYSNAP